MPKYKPSPIYKHLLAIGLSKSYASQIASGQRAAPLAVACRLFHASGVKIGPIAHATAREIATISRVLVGADQ